MAEADGAAVDSLQREYRQWKFASRLFNRLRDMLNGHQPPNPQRNPIGLAQTLFGRWLFTTQLFNWQQLHQEYPLFPRQPLEDERSRQELERMLREDFGLEADLAENIAADLLGMIDGFLTGDQQPVDEGQLEPQFEEHGDGGVIVVADFRTPRRIRVQHLVAEFGLMNTALVALRYKPLSLFKGGESGMSVSVLNAMRDIGQASFEGFASPLNCRLLGRAGIQFCSLFNDTDAAFGSLGNFFRINLAEHPGGWILNPPFVEPVMEATASRVVELLGDAELGSFWFYITFPMWEDNAGWQILDQSEWTVARLDFNQQTFVQQDWLGYVYTPNKLRLRIFVLGQLPDDVNLVALRNRIANVDAATTRADWLEACGIPG